ncbi:MAG TPA: PA2169 family four-helix-bundle protein [Rhodanobacteraceae bacterium]|nr:PA2169 family four-helix-bundle protein [Rhodanobacteraceae bacterium]
MTNLIPTLQEIAQICRDGNAFYHDAAEKMQDDDLRVAVQEVGRIRGALCEDIHAWLRQKGEEPSAGGTFYGTLHKLYADLRARLAIDSDRIYVAELEEAEDRLLHSLEQAILAVEPAKARAVLRQYMPAARAAHERMRMLKQALTERPAAA